MAIPFSQDITPYSCSEHRSVSVYYWHMKLISPYDASVLSYLARHSGISDEQKKRVTANLRGEALKVAKELSKVALSSTSNAAPVRTARGLRAWATDNDQLARRVSKRRR